MKEKAEQLLSDMRKQAAHFDEQLKMTQGAIQVLETLLAFSDKDNTNDLEND